MNSKKLLLCLLLAFMTVGCFVLVTNNRSADKSSSGHLTVTASYYPFYDFARQVGGDKVQVTNMTPAGAEPHDYEPSPKALADAQRSAVFIYNGGRLEPWVPAFVRDYPHVAIKASINIPLQQIADEENGSDPVQDPHFWLDPVLAQAIIATIRDGLSKADPANAAYYAANARQYSAKLQQLDEAFRTGLASCQTRTIVTSHAAFGYLAKRYNLTVYSIAGVSPDTEPSPTKLAELSRLVQDNHISYVFFESLVSPRLAATIATETGAHTLVFDPIEGLTNAAQKQGKNYLTVQQSNLQNLRTALACR